MIVTLHCEYSHDENGQRHWVNDNLARIMIPSEIASGTPKGIKVILMTEDELETITDFQSYQLKKAMLLSKSSIIKPLQLVGRQEEILEYQDTSYFKILQHVEVPLALFDDAPEMVKIGIEYC